MASGDNLAVETWAARVCANAALPDERLNARFVSVLAVLAAKPTDSIPQAFGDWGPTKAAYRFFENDRVTVPHLHDPIVEATAASCAGLPVLYAIQDTTSLNFSNLHDTTGLGPINDSPARGLMVHSTLALDPEGIPLGLLGQETWARPVDEKTAVGRRERTIKEKESRKWLDGINDARRALATLGAAQRPRLVHVADRECDIHEVFAEILRCGDGAVIRCAQDRKIEGDPKFAHAAVRAAPCLGTGTIEVSRQAGRPARRAQVEYRAIHVRLAPDTTRRPDREMLDLNLVEVWEPEVPEGVEALHWLLWTTEPIETLEEVRAVAGIYRFRWPIEDVHLTLKSGCRIEDLRFETAERLKKAIVVYSAIAVRIVGMRDRVRRTPDAPCSVELSEDEWRVLWAHKHDRPAAAVQTPPTLRQAVLWIGRLGGHLGRKRDGMPGVRTLWRGLRDLQILVAGYRITRLVE